MSLNFLSPAAKRKLTSQLDEQYGITQIPSVLLETGKQKIRAFSGTMTRQELHEFSRLLRIESVGLYIVKRDTTGLRLGLDGTTMLGKYATQNVFEMNEEQMQTWMRGENILTKLEKGFWILKHNTDYCGCGISNGVSLINHVPKERRIRAST